MIPDRGNEKTRDVALVCKTKYVASSGLPAANVNIVTGKTILFLDFDGVLHGVDDARLDLTGARAEVVGGRPFRYLPLLASLLASHSHVEIVVSSAWQDHCSDDDLRRFLGDLGDRFIGTTGGLGAGRVKGSSRLAECEAVAVALGVGHWLMVDDQVGIVFGSGVPSREQARRVVFCDSTMGLATSLVLDRIETLIKSQLSGGSE